MQHMIQRARTLHEALPYIRKFSGKTIVVKYGGHAMVDPELRSSFAHDIVLLKYVGVNPVVVHGGGPQINRMLDRLGIQSQFVNGLRVTDDATMEVVEMVLGGQINKEIVTLIASAGGKAVGLTGKDAMLIEAARVVTAPGQPDLGHVGDVVAIHPQIIDVLEAAGYIPVVAPVGTDRHGQAYNINADIAAAALARSLKAEKFVLMTDVDGVKDGSGNKISVLDRGTAQKLIDGGVISGGMIPKVEYALNALEGGVQHVHIINGKTPHALLLELFTDEGIGTMFEHALPYSAQ